MFQDTRGLKRESPTSPLPNHFTSRSLAGAIVGQHFTDIIFTQTCRTDQVVVSVLWPQCLRIKKLHLPKREAARLTVVCL